MIPDAGCDPQINVVRIGAHLLKILTEGPHRISLILERCSFEFDISVDHVILSLDWLYMISAIGCSGDQIFVKNETN